MAIWAVAFDLGTSGRHVSASDYQKVAQVLNAKAAPGDVVLLYPWWTDRARVYLPEKVPIVGWLHSDTQPLIRHPRIWVLAEPDQPESDLAGFLARFGKGRVALGPARRFGNLWLRLFRNDLARPVRFTGTKALASAHVYLEDPNGTRRDCPFDGKGFRCAGHDAPYVAAEWHEVFYRPTFCLRMNPPGGAERVVAEFDHVPSAPLLRLSAGYTWDRGYSHDPDLSTVHVSLDDLDTGEPLAHVDLVPGHQGLFHADAKLDGTGTHRVKLWVQADNPRLRDMCVRLAAFGPKPAESAARASTGARGGSR